MAGGTAVIALSSAAMGGVGGGVLVNKYVGRDKSFDVKTRKRGDGPHIVVVNGFLTEDKDLLAPWRPALKQEFSEQRWFEVAWQSKNLKKLGRLALTSGSRKALNGMARRAAKRATRQAGKRLNPLAWVILLQELAGNPWFVACMRSEQVGAMLADLIARADGRRRYVLVGHSLGARAIYFALRHLSSRSDIYARIRDVHLLGGAVDRGRNFWKGVSRAVSGRIYNYYSENDLVLKGLYRAGTFFSSHACGSAPILLNSSKIKNIDVSEWVKRHGEYKKYFPEFVR